MRKTVIIRFDNKEQYYHHLEYENNNDKIMI